MWLKMIGVVLLGCVVTTVSSECSQPTFKEDAVSRVEAGYKTIRKRGRLSYDYSTVDIVYYPFLMVEDPACIEESQLNLQVKSGSGDWIAIDEAPEVLGGGKYKWTVNVVPCKDHLIKFWVNGPGGQAALEYPDPIRAVSDEELIMFKYKPAKPTGLVVNNLDGNTVEVSWEPADCATSYDISYGKDSDSMQSRIVPASEGNQLIISEGIEPCTDYDISIFSVIGEDEYSVEEAAARFTTPPDADSASSLEPDILSTENTMTAFWAAYDKLSCVEKYSVSVCKEQEDCLETREVVRNDALDRIQFDTEDLDHCSAYTLEIQPLYDGQELTPKIVNFRTQSPTAENVGSSLLPVSAMAGEGQQIFVSWSAVQCAEYYEVYQKVNSEDGDWEVVLKTTEISATLNGVPCTEYRYGVQVTIDGVKSEILEIDGTVVTELDDSAPFVAPNLEINPVEDGAVLTWDHGACISSYVIKACSATGDTVCEEKTIERDSTVHNITHEIEGLHPCSPYYIEILPEITGKEFEPDHTEFRTAFPAPAPPADFSAVYRKGSNKVELTWSEVECASGYKIMQMIGNSETTTAWETNDPRLLFTTLDSPEPCVTYSYGVAATVGDELSEPTPMESFSIPPRQGLSHQPNMEIVENTNDTISLSITPADTNLKCQVEVYELRFSSLKQEETEQRQIYPDSLENGHILISFPGASGPGFNLEGRIKYDGFDNYSPWIRSRDPAIQSQEQMNNNSLLVPIIIGILVGIVVLVIIIFFVVKRKRNQTKYDAEKATASKDETQKLNDHPDA